MRNPLVAKDGGSNWYRPTEETKRQVSMGNLLSCSLLMVIMNSLLFLLCE
jgi:hypothetical protein